MTIEQSSGPARDTMGRAVVMPRRDQPLGGVLGSEVETRPFAPEELMRCPECGVLTSPYGGFGPAEEWKRVGKYRCASCNHVWYADPRTGQEYRRTRRRIVAIKGSGKGHR
jgi:hypothetical protein